MRLDDAIDRLLSALAAHPECDLAIARQAAYYGQPRPHAVFGLRRLVDTDAGEGHQVTSQRQALAVEPDVDQLADELDAMRAPLAQGNPISAAFDLGVGPGTLAASFGLELLPETGFQPDGHLSLERLLDAGPPDPATSGLMPAIRRRIELIRAHCPDAIKINLPDLQGPFNLAHMLLGDDAMLAPLERPEEFHRAMMLVTDLILGVRDNLNRCIGSNRLPDRGVQPTMIAECSANMVSASFYREHILPHDQRLAQAWGAIAVHTCSGPHVFHETLQGLPGICVTEAGHIPKAVAGWTRIEHALDAIGQRPIVLNIGQELPEGNEEQMIRADLERLVDNPRLLLNYTGMRWSRQDDAMIRDLHVRLDDYYQEQLQHRRAITSR